MTRTTLVRSLQTGALTFLVACFAAPAAHADATVYIVHGINGGDLGTDPALPVDISASGVCLLEGFTFGEIAGPLAVAAGTYDLAISFADPNAPCSNDAVISAPGVEFLDGVSYSVVAHLTEEGAPTASVFVNETTTYHRYATVNAFHGAVAPTVDIEFSRTIFFFWKWIEGFFGVSNGQSASKFLYQGDWDLTFFPAGGNDAAFGPLDIELAGETAYAAYAVGSLGTGSFTVLLTTLEEAIPDAEIYVVHGINGGDLGLDPNLPVDISANGACLLEGFTFGEIAGPVAVPAGTYDLAVALADPNTPCGGTVVIPAPGVELEGGVSYSIVAHLTEGGAPTATVFENDLETKFGKATVNLFHGADAPAVDIVFERHRRWWWQPTALFDVTNGQNASVNLFRGWWEASIFPADGDDPVFGPAKLALQSRTVYLVYAVGSVATDSFTVLIGEAQTD